ncbi:hypothetical protein RA26_01615 [Leisingera sp. ANG-M7]|nr:hypothetical protein RA26_01615 [Leisingera sp. ANG-M7]
MIAAALITACSSAAHANNLTGNDLHRMCNQHEGSDLLNSACAFWVIGAWEGMKWGAASVLFVANEGGSAAQINQDVNLILGTCAPESATWEQQTDVFAKYLADHPETRHDSARSLLLASGREAFPCGGTN